MAWQQSLLETFQKQKRPRLDDGLDGSSLIDSSDSSDSDTELHHEDSTLANSEMDIMPLNESNDLILDNDEEPMNQANLPASTSKTYIHTTMKQERLNHLMMIYIHKDRKIDFKKAIKKFVHVKENRLNIF